MGQSIKSASNQEMGCRLFGTKLLFEPMLAYESWEQAVVKIES